LFLVFVTVQGFADRYDHEYYWGVLVCACFWHALGIVWLAILFVLVIAVGAAA
jgi:cytochrome c oxidase subunit III